MFSKLEIPSGSVICGVISNGFTRSIEVIEYCERTGYIPALIKNESGDAELDTTIRLAQKCFVDDLSNLREDIFKVCLPYLPIDDDYLPIGLSRLHVIKYEQGNYFKKHYDESYNVGESVAEMTVIVYLNDDFEGGETIFHDLDKQIIHKPKKNDVLIFDHDHLHEGSMITKGVKYIIRGDVLYSNKKM